MKKIFCAMLTVLLMTFFAGCGQKQAATDVNKIPTEVATDDNSTPEPEPEPQAGKDYVLAADDLSNLQLDNQTIPVYDKYTIWERKELGLPVALPQLNPYTAESTVYLTFDDGPDDVITPQILDILKAEGVKATFYVCGNMVETYPEEAHLQGRSRNRQSQLQSPLRRALRQSVGVH